MNIFQKIGTIIRDTFDILTLHDPKREKVYSEHRMRKPKKKLGKATTKQKDKKK